MTKEELFNMELHENKRIEESPEIQKLDKGLMSAKMVKYLDVRRVWGGWIYSAYLWDASNNTPGSISQCFVPQ